MTLKQKIKPNTYLLKDYAYDVQVLYKEKTKYNEVFFATFRNYVVDHSIVIFLFCN